jgi:diaminopimelate decarboxylase
VNEVLPDTAQIRSGRLSIGGVDAADLADRYGTPLIVFDRVTFEARARAFAAEVDAEQVFYAGKSFLCVAVAELLDDLGLGLDVCTGGELATALAASFPAGRIIFHGNNKSEEELRAAKDTGVGRIVVDSFDEIERLRSIGVGSDLLVRITPGVEAHTHEYVQTGQEDSKFGFTLADGIALEALRHALDLAGDRVSGVHAHIGSQIFELTAFDLAVARLATFLVAAHAELGFEARELNLGGGIGIAHTRDEVTPDPARVVKSLRDAVEREFAERGLRVPRLLVEPGRAIAGPSGVTIYRVGTVKRIPGVRTYVAVDGGMSDNPRHALYGARYEALLAERAGAPATARVTIAGKHCESGDVVTRDVRLPSDVAPGDLLAVPATGAYTYAMASNYNRVPRPAVVMVEGGDAIEIVARESHLDLLRLDRRADGSPL